MRPQDDYILCREDEELDRSSRSSGGVIVPVMYSLTGKDMAESLFMARVVEVGPGKPNALMTLLHGGAIDPENIRREPICVAPGDMLMMLENMVSYRVTLQQRPHFVVQNRFVAGVLKEDMTVEPRQNYVLVQADPERARRATIGKGILHLASVEVDTDDIQRSRGIQAEYGVVLSKGPGCWDDGLWREPNCEVGDLILYDKSHSTLPVMIKGKAYTLVPSSQIILSDPAEVVAEKPQRTTPRIIVHGTMTTGPAPTA